jgi:chaperonin GroES
MNLRPIQNVIIVRPIAPPSTLPSGLLLAQAASIKPCEGTVLAVGPGARSPRTGRLQPTELQPGDTVLYEHGKGIRVDYQGEKLLFMREVDVAGVLPDGPQGNQYDSGPYYEQSEITVRK